jgi:predicted ATPase/DNA-binding SARP family transcriptional activator
VNPQLRLIGDVAWTGTPIAGERIRSLLRLLGDAGPRGLSNAELIQSIWTDSPPAHPPKALQILVSRARSQTSTEAIARTESGYRLGLVDDDVDMWAAASSLADAEEALANGAISRALEAAERASALGDDDRARRVLAIAASRQGRHRDALPELDALTRADPLDEELAAEHLRALAAVDGPTAALERFESLRGLMADSFGSSPGPVLHKVHEELLALDQPVRSGLRHSATSLLGRHRDIAALTGLLSTARLVTIVGPGGLGKTRLAQEIARLSTLPRVHVVELATIGHADEILGAIADSLHVRETVNHIDRNSAGPDLRRRVIASLSTGPNLLVLDNCEHLIDGVAAIVNDLLAAVADLRILTTSRTPLRHTAEHVYLLEQLPSAEAKELFVQRARAARPTVTIADDTVAALVDHLDGLPLAIELAAARTRTLTAESILDNLTDRFALLRGGDRTAPQRHQTLEAVIDWSWQLLDDGAKTALMTMSLLPDAFGADCAEEILGTTAMRTIEDLVDQSLLTVIERKGRVRFRMLETIREYGHLRRRESGERERIGTTVEQWVVDTCERLVDDLLGPGQLEAVRWLRAEEHNLTPALRRFLDRADDRAIVMLAALLPYWMVSGEHIRIIEHFQLLERFLSNWAMPAHLAEHTRRVLAVQTTTWGMLPRWHELPATAQLLDELGSESADPIVRAMARLGLVIVQAPETSQTTGAAAELRELTESDDRLTRLVSVPYLSGIQENAGEVADAIALLDTALDDFRADDPPWLPTRYQESLAQLHLQHGDFSEAREHAEAALPTLAQFGDSVECRSWLAFADLGLGELDRAEDELTALAKEEDQNEPFGNRYMLLLGRAELALLRGNVTTGLDLLSRVRRTGRTRPVLPGVPISDGLDPWTMLIGAVSTVVAARHDPDSADELFDALIDRAERATAQHRVHYDFPVLGTVAFAIAVWLRQRGQSVHGVDGEQASRFAALADRFAFNRVFPSLDWPTLIVELTTAQVARIDEISAELDSLDFAEAITRYHDDVRALRRCVGRT